MFTFGNEPVEQANLLIQDKKNCYSNVLTSQWDVVDKWVSGLKHSAIATVMLCRNNHQSSAADISTHFFLLLSSLWVT